MTFQNPAAESARENARHADGKFGVQALTEADIDLQPVSRSRVTGIVEVDEAVYELPPFSAYIGGELGETSRARDFATGPLVEYVRSRGGGRVDVIAEPGLVPKVAARWNDPQLGQLTAVYHTSADEARLASLTTTDGVVDLTGTPAWAEILSVAGTVHSSSEETWAPMAAVELTESDRDVLATIPDPRARLEAERTIRALTATGFAPPATGYDPLGSRVLYDLEDGYRLELTRGLGHPSTDACVAREIGDTGEAFYGGYDFYDDSETTTARFHPVALRMAADRAISGYVYGRTVFDALGAPTKMRYAEKQTTVQQDGAFVVTEIPVSGGDERIKVVETDEGDLTVSALSSQGQDLIYSPTRRRETLLNTVPEHRRGGLTGDRVAEEVLEAHCTVSRSRTEDPNWTRFAPQSASV